MLRKYRVGIDFGGLILFFVIMLPNFIWFSIPAPNDVLRTDSVTPHIDMIASIFQVLMIVVLCVLINKERRKLRLSSLMIITMISLLLYFACWIFYYMGITNGMIIIGMTVFPCLAFLFFAVDRKKIIAIGPILIFMVCHMLYGFANFIVH